MSGKLYLLTYLLTTAHCVNYKTVNTLQTVVSTAVEPKI